MPESIDVALLQRDIARTTNRLESLDKKIRKKILRKAMRAATKPILKELRQQATRRTGNLKRIFAVQVTTEKGELIVGKAGQKKAMRKRRKAPHLHLVDQDTKPHTIKGAAFMNRAGELIRGDMEHPGTTGDKFVESVQRATKTIALKAFADKSAAELKAEVAGMGKA